MLHCIPIGNGEPIHEAGPNCWCRPTDLGEGVTAHNSKDGREKYERQGYVREGNKWVIVGERSNGA